MQAPHTPLAERLRPRTLGEVIGQQHILGEGMALRLAFDHRLPIERLRLTKAHRG